MAVSGSKQKPEGERRHRVKPVHDWIEVQRIPFSGAPAMPLGRWRKATRRWWEVVSRMPHCILWDESDWQFAADTLRVHGDFVRGEKGAAVELRQREKILGTTLDARRDLRIRYIETTPEEESQGVTAIEDYKKRLRG